jgi:hypothetical protein
MLKPSPAATIATINARPESGPSVAIVTSMCKKSERWHRLQTSSIKGVRRQMLDRETPVQERLAGRKLHAWQFVSAGDIETEALHSVIENNAGFIA